jgi:hypothetical protein
MTDSKIRLDFQFDTKRQAILKSRGVDGNLFANTRNKFEFEEAVCRMKPEIRNVMNRGIPVKRQIRQLNSMLEHPLRSNVVVGIGSFPSDNRAKIIALNIMNRAVDMQIANTKSSRKNKRLAGKNYPLWHKVFGGFGDELRDNGKFDNPSMLIISNIGIDSTPMKVEKVRDILEKYTAVPRIVIVNGCCPMKFFATKLFLPMNYGFYVGSDNKTTVLEF